MAGKAALFTVVGAGLAVGVAFSALEGVYVVAFRSFADCTLVGLFINLEAGGADEACILGGAALTV